MRALLANAGGGVVETATKFVGEMILGGIALLCLGGAYWCIKELKLAKDAHIAAMDTASTKRERTAKDNAEAYQRTATATVGAIQKLTSTEDTQTDAIRTLTTSLNSLTSSVETNTRTIDSVLRDAVRGARAPEPEGGE